MGYNSIGEDRKGGNKIEEGVRSDRVGFNGIGEDKMRIERME